jgi:fumarate hydratase, class II
VTNPASTRTERDTFGPIDVPADKLWGAQTQRSLQNFDISGEQQPREIIHALAQIKRSSARVNHALGLQDEAKTSAIVAAADEVIAGKHRDEFPLVHADQHERQRGAGQPRQRVDGRRAG